MKIRPLLVLVCTLLLLAGAGAQEPLERAAPPATPVPEAVPTAAPATPPVTAAAPTAPLPPPAAPVLPPTPPVQPADPPNAVGLVVLALILAHVCVPMFLIGYLLLGWVVLKLCRTTLPMLAMGIVQRGGLPAFKKIGIALGVLIVLPSGLMGLRWAARILGHPMEDGPALVFGFGISVVTGIVFLSLVKAIARRVKQQLAGKMGGGLPGMGGFPPGGREKQAKPGKRGQRPPDRKKLR